MIYDSMYACISEGEEEIILSLFSHNGNTSLSLAPMQELDLTIVVSLAATAIAFGSMTSCPYNNT